VSCPDGQCFTDVPPGNTFYTFINSLYIDDIISGYPCGGPGEPCDGQHRPYYRPGNNVTRGQMSKFVDNGRRNIADAVGLSLTIHAANSNPLVDISNTLGTAIYAQTYTSTSTYAAIEGSAHGTSTGVGGVSDSGYGVLGLSLGGPGVAGGSVSGDAVKGDSTSGYGVHGTSDGPAAINGYNPANGYGVEGVSAGSYGLRGESLHGPAGVNGYNDGTGFGVEGVSTSGYGVRGRSPASDGVNGLGGAVPGVAGVRGTGTGGEGVVGLSTSDVGVYAESGSGSGIYATSGTGYAGYFHGDVNVTGNLSKGGGSFKIDDPIDPANKYLYHSFVESPDMMDIYNGNITTDQNGDAIIQLPVWFDPLNRDFRYQLTPIGQFAQAMVSKEIENNQFSIKTDKPHVEVSWQVTGIRQDPYANAHRIPVEQDKPANEKGKYLYPTEYGQPLSSGIDYQRQQQMQQGRQGQQAPQTKP
jgi:hypothetical protein